MAAVVVIPKLGLTMREGAVARWLVEVGETVVGGQPLCEIETDKITTEVEAPASGVLLRRIAADEDVPVGAAIALVGHPGEEAAAALHGEAGAEAAPAASGANPGSPGEAAAGATAPAAPAPPAGVAGATDPPPAGVAGATEPPPAGVARATEPPPAGGAGATEPPPAEAGPARGAVSPVARRLAAELGIDLAKVRGSGPGGRIVRRDVEAAAGIEETEPAD
jgi:pyruvate dehydrogenase E2 component (dihydrolipoamide acetyltransferase)